jgi:16S rRNA (guanine527-N7)-methyltransferase
LHKVLRKEEIIKRFFIKEKQEELIQKYIDLLSDHNKHTNLVGKSTLLDPWKSHILDSLQILPLIKNKKSSILDMGSGAGFPGNALSILGCQNVILIDSNGKKINFLKRAKKDLGLKSKIILGRVEDLKNTAFDIITSRALANLSKLFSYSHKFVKKNTVLIFLKGKTVNEEVEEARKKWNFQLTSQQSISDSRGSVLIIKNIRKK